MNAPYGGDRGRTPGDGSGRPEDLYEQDPYGQRPHEDRDRAPGVPYGEDPSTVQFTGGPRGDEDDDAAWQPYGQQSYGTHPPHAQHPEPAQHPQAPRPAQVPPPHQPPQQGQHPQQPPADSASPAGRTGSASPTGRAPPAGRAPAG